MDLRKLVYDAQRPRNTYGITVEHKTLNTAETFAEPPKGRSQPVAKYITLAGSHHSTARKTVLFTSRVPIGSSGAQMSSAQFS